MTPILRRAQGKARYQNQRAPESSVSFGSETFTPSRVMPSSCERAVAAVPAGRVEA